MRLRQHRAQFRLTDHDDLQQLALVGLKVGQQTHLLENLGGKVLGLVDDQHRRPAFGVGVQQEGVDPIDQPLDALATLRMGDAELIANGGEQLLGGQLRVEDEGDVGFRRKLFEEAAADRRLAGADLAGQQDEAAMVDAEQQVRERVAVLLAHVQIAGVGRDRERWLVEAEVAVVHPWPYAGCR